MTARWITAALLLVASPAVGAQEPGDSVRVHLVTLDEPASTVERSPGELGH
jgi:hypothetical protein